MGDTVRQWPYEMWGVECGKGWAGLYQPLIDLCELKGVKILQVKEKFGGLRLYCDAYATAPSIQLLIDATEAYSYRVCEDCGRHGVVGWDEKGNKPIYEVTTKTSETSSWIRSLCDPCRVAWDTSRREFGLINRKK